MALTLEASGTVTADGTEQTLATETGGGVFVLEVDTNAMVLGDKLELRIYTKTLTGGTSRQMVIAYYEHVQADIQKTSFPIAADIEWKATLKQTAGTNRDYPWKALSI